MSYKTRALLTAWLVGLGTGAGIVVLWQLGDWQHRLVEALKKWA